MNTVDLTPFVFLAWTTTIGALVGHTLVGLAVGLTLMLLGSFFDRDY